MVRWPRGGYRLWEEKYGLATHWTTCPSLSEFWYFQERCTVVSLSDSSFSLWEGNRSHYNRVWNLVGTWGLRWEEPVKTSESESAVGTGPGGWLCWVPPSCFSESRNAASLRRTLTEHLHHVWQVYGTHSDQDIAEPSPSHCRDTHVPTTPAANDSFPCSTLLH